MTRRATVTAGLLLTALAATTTACGTNQGQAASRTPTPSSTSPTPAPSATPSTTTLSPAEQDAQAAEQAVITLWRKLNELGADPERSLNELAEVARDQALDQWRRNLTSERRDGQRSVGAAAVTSASAQYAGRGVYDVTACVDVSDLNVVDDSGQSVVMPNHPPRMKYLYEVTETDDGFFVTQDKLERRGPC